MPKLVFRVQANYEEVIKLRDEIEKLKKELKSMDATASPIAFNTLNTQLSVSTKKMDEMVTEAAKLGAEMGQDLKRQIFEASQTVNGFTSKIIEQKAVVKDVEADVRRLGEAYRNEKKNNPWGADSHLAEYNAARKALDEEKAALFALTQEQAKARLSVKQLRDEYALFKKEGGESVDVTKQMEAAMLNMGKKVLGGIGIKEFIGQMIKVRGEFQAADTAIQTLLGSEEKANALMSQVREYAKISPLEFSDVTQATQMMLGFNIEAEKVPRFLQAIGDVSMGNTQSFNSLTLAFSQMSAAGKLMGQDLNQMINAGFNPLQTMSDKTGKSIAQLKEEMSKGAISAEMVQQAFIDATSAGGKFYKMSENASKTINGQLSMMQDAMDAAFNEMGQKSEGFIIGSIQMTTKLIENYETVGKVLAGLVVTYGTYKAVLITNIALTKSWAIAARTDAIAKGIQTTATKALTVAQWALNAAMKANPYVMIATLVAGLGATLWAFTKTTNQAAEAQKRLDEATANMRKEIVSEQADIDILFNDLKNAKEGTDEYRQAKDAILNKYGKYLEGLNEEIRTLSDVKGAYDAITVAATKAARARGMETAMRGAQEAYGESYSGNAGKLYDKLREKVGDTKATSLLNKLQKEISKTGKASQKVREEIGNIFRGSATYGDSRTWITSMENATKTLQNETKKIKAVFGDVEKESDKVNTKSVTKNKKYYEDEKKKAQAELDALTVAEAKGSKGKKLRKKIAEYKQNIDVYDASGKSEEKARKVAEKKQKEEAKAEKKNNDAILKLQQENRQAQLDLEEDTTENKLQLIDLSYDKQKAEISKKERELAEQNKKAGTTGLNEKGLTAEQQEEIDKANKINEKSRKKQIADTYKAEMSAMRDYLKEYGSFRQQKLAITEEYAEKIEKAQNEGERLTLEKQRESALQKVEIDALRQEIDWKGLLGDFGGLFEEQLKPTLEKLRKYTESNEFKQADIQDQQVIYDLITKLTQETSDGWSGMFKNLGDATNNYREKVIALEKATEEAKKADEEYAIAKTKAGDNAATDENVKALGEAARNAAENQKAAQSDVIQAQNEMSDAATRVRSNLNNLVNGLQQLGSGSMSGILKGANSIAEIFKVNDLSGEIGKKLADGVTKVFGKAAGEALAGPMGGEIVAGVFSLLDLFKDGIENLFSSLIDTILGAVNGLLDTMLNGKIITSVASSLKDGIGNILDTITFGGFSSWITGSNAKEVAETIDRLTNRNELLTVAIEELTDEMANARGARAIDISRRAVNLQEETNKNYALMAQAQAGYHGSHHSWNYYWGGYSQEQINRLSQQIGREWNGDIWSLSPEEMKMLQGNVDMWEQILTTGKGGYGYSVGEKLQAYIDQAGKLEDITNQLYETLTTTTADNVFDDFLNSLYALADGSDEVFDNIADSWQQMVNKMAVNNIVGASFQEKLNDWYQRLAKLNESRTEGKITDEEYKAKLDILQKEYEDYVKKAQNDIESLRDVGVIQSVGSETEAQKATSRGFGSEMTHEDAGELSGRFTAMYESNIRIEAATQQQALAITELSGNMSNMIGQMQNMYNIADETRTILVNSFLELQQISENTGAIVKPIKQIQTDIAEVKRNTSRL